ncbi:MAG: hypothetical protein ABSD47_01255 [Candidatus Methylomirabilota bacterium]
MSGTGDLHRGLRAGEPQGCPCGGTLVVIFQEPIWSGPMHQKVEAGRRFFFRCDRCHRDLDVRWLERHALPAVRSQRSGGSGPGGTA